MLVKEEAPILKDGSSVTDGGLLMTAPDVPTLDTDAVTALLLVVRGSDFCTPTCDITLETNWSGIEVCRSWMHLSFKEFAGEVDGAVDVSGTVLVDGNTLLTAG